MSGVLEQALSVVARRLDEFLRSETGAGGALVAFASPGRASLPPDPAGANRLALAVAEIVDDPGGRAGMALLVLSAHRVTSIPGGLRLLSLASAWQQANAEMTPATVAEMPEGIVRVTLTPADLPRSEQMALRQTGGLGLAPAIFWQLRHVAVEAGIVIERLPRLSE